MAGLPRTETGFGIDVRTDGLTTPAFWLALPLSQNRVWMGFSTRLVASYLRDFPPVISPSLDLPQDLDYQAGTSLGLAWRISGPLSMGAALQIHLADGTNTVAASSPGLAIGLTLARTPGLPLSVSLAFLNIVPTLEPGRGSADLPWIWQVSAAWRLISWPDSLDLGLEWSGGEDRDGQLAAAVEYSIESRWFFRTGFAPGDSLPDWASGFATFLRISVWLLISHGNIILTTEMFSGLNNLRFLSVLFWGTVRSPVCTRGLRYSGSTYAASLYWPGQIQRVRCTPETQLPFKLRSRSRRASFLAIVSRLSWSFFPLQSPSSTLTRPREK